MPRATDDFVAKLNATAGEIVAADHAIYCRTSVTGGTSVSTGIAYVQTRPAVASGQRGFFRPWTGGGGTAWKQFAWAGGTVAAGEQVGARMIG